MILLEQTDFFEKTWGGRPNRMNVSHYDGYSFDCACGQSHIFNSATTHVHRELPKMRLVFSCPESDGYATCVKLKGWFRFKGFKSLFGTKIEIVEDTDNLDFMIRLAEKAIDNETS